MSKKIRTIEVSSFVSKVATITEVRAKLVEQQRKWEMIKELSWMVDIGTVVFQMLNLKYLQAQLSEQALR
jgi:cytidylate kinase